MSFVFIHSARQLITVRGGATPRRGPELAQLYIVEDGAVLIEGDRIREVGPTRRVENLAEARKAREISAAGRVVMPGFVDSHTHLLSGPPRVGSFPPRDARVALTNLAVVRETSGKRLISEASAVLKQALAHGTTTLEAKSGSALNASGESKILRVLTALGDSPVDVVPTFFGAHTVPPEFEGRPGEYIEWLSNDLMPTVSKRGLARFVDGCADAGGFAADELLPYFNRARELGFGLRLHDSQFAAGGGTTLVRDFAFTSVDHLEHAGPAAIAALPESGAVATITPASSFYLGVPRAPARDLIAAGVPIALASGFNRLTTPTYNMQFIVFLACHEFGLAPAEALAAATINGAHALRLGHRVGSLEPGKQADLLILNVGDYRELACEFGINLVGVTIKRGAVVFDGTGVKWPAR